VNEVLAAALAEHRDGHALPTAFTVDPAIHDLELERIWRRSWLLAALSIELPAPGDFVRFSLSDADSLLIVRGRQGELHALHNTCRHRGMPVCEAQSGTVRRWVCPYHQWSYDLDGRLLGDGGGQLGLDAVAFGLGRAAVRELDGLVFVWLGSDEPDRSVNVAAAELAPALRAQGIASARVAHAIDYDVAADWKLVWENNRECWHCHAGHPEYIRANFDAAGAGPTGSERVRELAAARAADHAAVLGAHDAEVQRHDEPGLFAFPTGERWWSSNRAPSAPGFVTESIDGLPVAPLMGEYSGHDIGTLRMRAVPNFWCHASADHAVLTRLLPDGPGRTRIRVSWLVDAEAQPERDYELDRLLPFWQLTSEQDWALCEANQRGVRNRAFRGGPYSPEREYNVLAFQRWYLQRMGAPH
jgi:glycine betaine catabolism A